MGGHLVHVPRKELTVLACVTLGCIMFLMRSIYDMPLVFLNDVVVNQDETSSVTRAARTTTSTGGSGSGSGSGTSSLSDRESSRRTSGRRIPLWELTKSREAWNMTCPQGQVTVLDTTLQADDSHDANTNDADLFPKRRKIPRIVHQTSRTRCLPPEVKSLTDKWRLENHSYYFHDDNAIDALFFRHWPEFPHLETVARCIQSGTIKADLWRYLVLWEYGGIYSDLDTIPNFNRFNSTIITPDDDSFFVIESVGVISQYFMASSPRHPLIYFTIQQALLALLQAEDIGLVNAAFTTGPRALANGWEQFMKTVGVTGIRYPPAGLYVGYGNRTTTVVGSKDRSNDYIIREAMRRGSKKQHYRAMNMTHFHDDRRKTEISCFTHMLGTSHNHNNNMMAMGDNSDSNSNSNNKRKR